MQSRRQQQPPGVQEKIVKQQNVGDAGKKCRAQAKEKKNQIKREEKHSDTHVESL